MVAGSIFRSFEFGLLSCTRCQGLLFRAALAPCIGDYGLLSGTIFIVSVGRECDADSHRETGQTSARRQGVAQTRATA
jgi:hypothetical protein